MEKITQDTRPSGMNLLRLEMTVLLIVTLTNIGHLLEVAVIFVISI